MNATVLYQFKIHITHIRVTAVNESPKDVNAIYTKTGLKQCGVKSVKHLINKIIEIVTLTAIISATMYITIIAADALIKMIGA